MAKLHEISADYLAVQDEDLPAEVIADTLEAIEGEFELKADNIGRMVQNWENDIEALKAHKATIDAKIKTRQNRIDHLKDYLRNNMEATGIKKIESPLFNVTCVPGRDVVQIDDEQAIPDELMAVKVTEAPDKKAILKALQEGDDVPGASLTKSKSSIRIK